MCIFSITFMYNIKKVDYRGCLYETYFLLNENAPLIGVPFSYSFKVLLNIHYQCPNSGTIPTKRKKKI